MRFKPMATPDQFRDRMDRPRGRLFPWVKSMAIPPVPQAVEYAIGASFRKHRHGFGPEKAKDWAINALEEWHAILERTLQGRSLGERELSGWLGCKVELCASLREELAATARALDELNSPQSPTRHPREFFADIPGLRQAVAAAEVYA